MTVPIIPENPGDINIDDFMYEMIMFKDRIVEFPNFIECKNAKTEEITKQFIKQIPGEIFQEGTPLNAEHLGYMDVAIWVLYQKLMDFKGDESGIYFDQGKWWRAEFNTVDGDPVITRTELIDYVPKEVK